MTTTTTLTMTDLVSGHWTADEDIAYEGYAHATRTWNGWRVCYFTDAVMQKIVEDVREFGADWYLTIEGNGDDEVVYEVTPEGEMVPFAERVIVDGVVLWDTFGGGWTWCEASCAACETMTAEELAETGWGCGSCGLEFAHDDGIHDVQDCGGSLYHEFTCAACYAEEQADA
jgi:hypothetical protein